MAWKRTLVVGAMVALFGAGYTLGRMDVVEDAHAADVLAAGVAGTARAQDSALEQKLQQGVDLLKRGQNEAAIPGRVSGRGGGGEVGPSMRMLAVRFPRSRATVRKG